MKTVKNEVKSLLLTEIESKYGKNPTNEELNLAISNFGAPGKIAKRYSGDRIVIGPGLTDLYFLVMKTIVFAMAVAFTTIFIVTLFSDNLLGMEIVKEFSKIPLNVFNASISGIGILTIIFIIMTKFEKEYQIDLEKDWNPKELKGIPLGKEVESKLECIVSIFFFTVLIVIINLFPQLISAAERLFEQSGIILGNRINLDHFTGYAIIMTILWMIEIVYHLLIVRIGIKTKTLSLMSISTSIVSVVLFAFMVTDRNLFIYASEATTSSLIGFKAIFLIVLVVSGIELLVTGGKWIYHFIEVRPFTKTIGKGEKIL